MQNSNSGGTDPQLPPHVVGKRAKSLPGAAPAKSPSDLPKQAPRRLQEARRFGNAFMAFGAVSIVAPFFGLTFRKVNDPVVMQFGGMVCFAIGAICWAVSFNKGAANIGAMVTKGLLWLVVGLLGLIVIAAIIALIYSALHRD